MSHTKWGHLPNAVHIDAVLAHIRQHPDKWAAARGAARAAARGAALDAARGAALDAARGAARAAAWGAARGAAMDAVRALIAWDDCAYILELPPEALLVLIASGNQPAILLLPAVLAMNGETHDQTQS